MSARRFLAGQQVTVAAGEHTKAFVEAIAQLARPRIFTRAAANSMASGDAVEPAADVRHEDQQQLLLGRQRPGQIRHGITISRKRQAQRLGDGAGDSTASSRATRLTVGPK